MRSTTARLRSSRGNAKPLTAGFYLERGEENLPLAGLCVGITLLGIGCDVDVYERTPGSMTSRGAGIVVREDLLSLLQQHGAPELPAVSCAQRLYLQPEGGDGAATPMP